MPVTARLSQRFYERLGEDIATELVDWFNAVDATYRSDLRELNELNFARFDAKLEQRATRIEAKIDREIARLEAKLASEIGRLEAKLASEIGRLEATMERRFAEQGRWMFVAWTTLLIAIVGMGMRR